MAYKPERDQMGFTLFEMLVALSIIGILWGVGLSVMPRLLSASGSGSLARLLAGAGQEAREMALLQQYPWELLVDLDQGVFYRAPLGAVHKRESRALDGHGDGSLDSTNHNESAFSSRSAQRGETREQDLIAQRRKELSRESTGMSRDMRRYDSLVFSNDTSDSDIFETAISDEVKIIQIRKQNGYAATEGRVSLVFGPRGFIQPTVVWVESAGSPGEDRYTLYFSGISPPVVVRGILLPDGNGILAPVELP